MATATKPNNTRERSAIKPGLGLSDEARAGVYKIHVRALADAFALRLKLRKYHWNVTGPQFLTLHEIFEEQYNALTLTIDEIAERIRTYGYYAPGTLEEFKELTRISENPDNYPDAMQMVKQLVADHESTVRNLREDIKRAGEEYEDVAAEDFFTGILQDHQEMAWMLRSFLES